MWFVMTFAILFVASCGYALWRGGTPERLVALLMIVGALLTMLAAPAWRWTSAGVDWGIFLVDLAVLLGLMAVALHANRFWPIWMSAVHGLSVLGHISVLVAPDISPLFYATLSMGSAWPAQLLLLIGTLRHHRRVLAGVADPDWTDFGQLRPVTIARA